MLYEIGVLLLEAAGAGEYYTLIDEEDGCSLTDAGRESCNKKSRKRICLWNINETFAFSAARKMFIFTGSQRDVTLVMVFKLLYAFYKVSLLVITGVRVIK